MTAAMAEWNEVGELASEEKELIKDVAGMVFEGNESTSAA